MKISRILCGEGKPDGRGPDATDARNTRPAQQQTQGPILVGEQTPENTFVEVQNTQSSASIEQTPMSNIQSLWVYVLERRHKIPEILRSMAGRRPRVDDGDTNIDLPSSILTKRKDSEIPRPHSSVSQSIPLGRSSDEDHTILLAERKVADKQVHQSARSASDADRIRPVKPKRQHHEFSNHLERPAPARKWTEHWTGALSRGILDWCRSNQDTYWRIHGAKHAL
jgi:hypothetical protein